MEFLSDGLKVNSPQRTSAKGPGGCPSRPSGFEKGDDSEKEMKMRKLLFGVLFASMAFGANSASADGWPSSVVGAWDVLGNHFPGTLNITSQANTGQCRGITGTIYGQSIQGFYCPSSGRIHFLRKLPGTNTTFQVWAGNLSQAATGCMACVNLMGGVFSSDLDGFGEYNWEASIAFPGARVR
jgi:hypothetical protein